MYSIPYDFSDLGGKPLILSNFRCFSAKFCESLCVFSLSCILPDLTINTSLPEYFNHSFVRCFCPEYLENQCNCNSRSFTLLPISFFFFFFSIVSYVLSCPLQISACAVFSTEKSQRVSLTSSHFLPSGSNLILTISVAISAPQ